MKKFLPVLLFAGMVLLAVGAYIYQNYEPYRELPAISLDRLNAQETAWYEEAIFDYRILVQVRFATEKRQYEIVVIDNVLSSAQSARWDEDAETWGPFVPTPEEEATFFTVSGMFSMLRRDLVNEDAQREVLRMALADDLPHPGVIYLGNLIQEDVVMEGTQLVVEVLEFEALSP